MSNFKLLSKIPYLLTLVIFSISIQLSSQRLDLTPISSFDEFRYDIFEIAPDGTWFIHLETGELLTSVDEGVSWEDFPLPVGEELAVIRFFDDGAPFVTTHTGIYYTWTNGQWNPLPDLVANQTSIYQVDGYINVDVVTLHNDTIWYAQDSLVFASIDRGLTSIEILKSDSLSKINTLRVSDNYIYLIGQNRVPNQIFQHRNRFYEKFDKNFQLVEKIANGVYEKFEVTNDDKIGFSTASDARSVDGVFTEFAHGIDTNLRPNSRLYDLEIQDNKVYITYNGYDDNNFVVIDLIDGQRNTYEINQHGTIHFYNDKIFIADKNKILDVTNYAINQIRTIIPPLKRTYTDAVNYKITNQGIIYAYTGFNVFVYSKQNNNWSQLDLAYDNIQDFDVSQDGKFYALSSRHFFVSYNNGNDIHIKRRNPFFSRQPLDFIYLSSLRVFDESIVLLYAEIAGFSGPYTGIVTSDDGDSFRFDDDFSAPYPIEHLGNQGVFSNGKALGQIVQFQFEPLWDVQNPELIGLPFRYKLLPVDSSLIYYYPSIFNNTGYILTTEDLGQSWTRSSFGPVGQMYKGSEYESSWIYNLFTNRLFNRSQLSDSYNEVDISSINSNLSTILAEPNGSTFIGIGTQTYPNSVLNRLGGLISHPQKISGKVYLDTNTNCQFDSGEELLGQAWTFTLTGDNYNLTTISIDGSYDFDVPIGDFELTVNAPSTLWTLCDSTYSLSVTTPGEEIIQDIAVTTDELCAQLEVSLSTPKLRRCRNSWYNLSVKNSGTVVSEEVLVDITPDPFLIPNFTTLDIPFETLVNGDLRFNFGTLAVQETKRLALSFEVSCLSDLGQQHCMLAEAFTDNLCASSTSQVSTEYQNNVGPFDPNDMRVFNDLGYQALNFEEEDRQYYHVRFQNTGTDTAENVEVRVFLDDSLDIESLRLLDSSHDFTYSLNDGHQVIVKFDNIMLPDSNVNEPASNGYFRLSAVPDRGVVPGQEFHSYSDIYFDFNAPIRTNNAVSRIGQQCGPPKVEEVEIFLCARESFEGYSNSGHYTDYLTTVDGCDSLRKLTITAQGFSSSFRQADVILCPGETYLGIDTTTFLRDTLLNYFGCDSVSIQNIYLVDWVDDFNISDSACEGDTILDYTQSGIYRDTIRNRSWCQIRILDLSITSTQYISESHTLCFGATLDSITTSGIYRDTIRNVDLCDSLILEREVIFLNDIQTSITIDGCDGEEYEGYAASGIYTDLFTSHLGCDSTRILTLNLVSIIETSEQISICEGTSYEGYSTSGTYTDTFTSIDGCDSIRTLDLEVFDTPTEFIQLEICSGEEAEGYETSGEYTDTFTSVDGCDSTRILKLEVAPASVFIDTMYLCPWEEFEGLAAPDTYLAQFTSAEGCDSIRQTDLILLERRDPGCAHPFDDDPKLISDTEVINVYPNPVTDKFVLEIKRPQQLPAVLTIMDSRKQLVSVHQITDHMTSIDVSAFASGLYIAVLRSGNNFYMEKVVKI